MKLMLVVAFAMMASAVSEEVAASPVANVVKLLKDLKERVESDGEKEQLSYDRYACWCEEKLGEKAKAISDAKDLISEQQILIEKLNGELGSGGATIAQLKKDLGKNSVSQKDAMAMRNKENQDYASSRNDLEQQIAAMEAAITAVTGAGTKKGFLETTHQAQLLSVAGQVRRVVDHVSLPTTMPAKDIALLKSFVAKPADFFSPSSSHAMSAAQVGQNPFGDYAPQSSRIQGIFKGMYDGFTSDLEKRNAEEGESQKSFEELMDTKKKESKTLSSALMKAETRQADNGKRLADATELRDDTADQLAADQTFFKDTKAACENKAKAWSVRTRLRTEELSGMEQALSVLSGGAATFGRSWSGFLQVSSVTNKGNQAKAYGKVKALAAEHKSMALAKIALAIRAGGHFDGVIASMTKQIAMLREEEQDDIVHRDECENKQNANANEIADLKHTIKKHNEEEKREKNANDSRKEEVAALEVSIKETSKDLAALLQMRNEEHAEFEQNLKDDKDSVSLMNQAIAALGKFYKNNGKFVQTSAKGPAYSVDKDKAPEHAGADYGGRKSETTGVVAALEHLVEDLEKEITEGKAEDADAEDKYNETRGALEASSDAMSTTKANIEEQVANGAEKINALSEAADAANEAKKIQLTKKQAISTDCSWVKSHFEKRRSKRKSEIQGLMDAQEFLSGGGDGLPPLE